MTNDTWQERLVARHPHLFVRSFKGVVFSRAYPVCPDGWQEVVTTAVERVSQAAKGYSVQFCEISEKCGRLRVYWKAESSLPAHIEACIADAIARGEARSACTCSRCGADDLAPKFYPIVSSLRLLDLPGWAVVATGAGAEPSA